MLALIHNQSGRLLETRRKSLQILGMAFVPFQHWGAYALVILVLIDTIHLVRRPEGIPIWRKLRALGEQGKERDWGPLLLAAGAALVLFLVPPPWSWAICSMAFIGDALAAVCGKALGGPRMPLHTEKTLAGSVACLTAVWATATLAGLGLTQAVSLSFIAAVVEWLAPRGWDNLLLPLSGLVVWMLLI